MVDLAEHPVRRYRKARSLSQEALGRLLGVTKFAVSKWESGDRNIEAPMAEKIESVTGIDARELLGIPKKPKAKQVSEARC